MLKKSREYLSNHIKWKACNAFLNKLSCDEVLTFTNFHVKMKIFIQLSYDWKAHQNTFLTILILLHTNHWIKCIKFLSLCNLNCTSRPTKMQPTVDNDYIKSVPIFWSWNTVNDMQLVSRMRWLFIVLDMPF